MIPYGRQDVSDDDVQAVINVLKSDFLTQGPVVPRFEETVALYCGASHAVAVSNATSALHIACLALGVGKGDIVWTSPITFVASANCALYCGASVDFVDIDARTYNLCAGKLEEKLVAAEQNGTLPKVVIPVHLAGQSADMAKIHELSKRFGFRIIEDASHAIGSTYRDSRVGSCIYSDITIFSFHPVKIITTGEGGMALTNDADLAKKMTRLRSHGITRYASEMTSSPDGGWYYQQLDLGFNYRMTEIQAALGHSQMGRLDEFVSQRQAIAARYDALLEGKPFVLPWQSPDTRSAFHLYVVRVVSGERRVSHKEVYDRLRSDGIGVNLHYIPVYRQPYYQQFGYRIEDFPEAERYYASAITLPIYPSLTEAQQDIVVASLLNPSGYQTLF